MKPSNIRQIIVEDFPKEHKDTIQRLSNILNFFMREVNQILSGNVDFDNLRLDLPTVTITVDASGKPIGNSTFSTKVTNPVGLVIVNYRNLTNPSSFLPSAPLISFQPVSNNLVRINNVAGLPENQRFQLVLLVI
jgi:hypothetical protein